MNILLTGYPGLLGKAVAERLVQEGHAVRVLLHATAINHRDLLPGVTVEWGSIGGKGELDKHLAGMDAVVHCAWDSRRYPAERFEQTNIQGSQKLLEAAARQGVRTFIHISSVAVYGLADRDGNAPLTEDSPYVDQADSLDVYPWAKVRVEKALSAMEPEGKPDVVIIRPGLLFSDEKPPAKGLVRLFGRTAGIVVGRGRNHLPWVHVADVADLVSRALQNPTAAPVLNAVPSVAVPSARFLRNWGRSRNRPILVLRVPAGVVVLAQHGAYRLKWLLRRQAFKPNTAYQTRSAVRNLVYSSDTAREQLGWTDATTRNIAEG